MTKQELNELKIAIKESKCSSERESFYRKFPLGFFWGSNAETLLNRVINDECSAKEKLFKIQNTFLYSVDTNDNVTKELTLGCWRSYFERQGIFLEKLSDAMQESEFYDINKLIFYKGKKYSLDFFRKLNTARYVKSIVDKSSLKVLEIGAGFGQVGRILKNMVTDLQYVIVDIPETLYFAYLFLRLNFPGSKIVWIKSKKDMINLKGKEVDFILVPCYFSEYLKVLDLEYDVAINTSSFGEMHNKTSKFYIDLIQKELNVEYIIFLNRFLNPFDPDIQKYRLNENAWYMNLDNKWQFLKWEIEPEFNRFPYHEVFNNRELFIVAQRSEQEYLVRDLETIYLNKWYRNFTLRASNRYSDFLYVDLGLGSTIEKLVNAVKCRPEEKSLDALIKYIYFLEGKNPYEERYYFTNLYKKITGKSHYLEGNPLFKFNLVKYFLKLTGLLGLGLFLVYKFPIATFLKKVFFKENWLI